MESHQIQRYKHLQGLMCQNTNIASYSIKYQCKGTIFFFFQDISEKINNFMPK